MAFESCIVPEDWRSPVIVPLYKGKGERTEWKNYRSISLSVVEKIYAGTLEDKVRKVNGGLIDNEQGGFRAGRGCVDLHTEADRWESKRKNAVYVGVIDLEKAYNREVLWQVLRMYDGGCKIWSGIKSLYVDSSACARIKGGESEQFRIDSGVKQGCIMSLWLFNVYME